MTNLIFVEIFAHHMQILLGSDRATIIKDKSNTYLEFEYDPNSGESQSSKRVLINLSNEIVRDGVHCYKIEIPYALLWKTPPSVLREKGLV